MDRSTVASPRETTTLTRRLGVPTITMMIIAASAPLTVIAGGSTSAYSVTGSIAVPIGFLVLALALAVFAIGYAAMSRHINNAGAFYAYISRGLGRPLGIGAALTALVAYNFMQIGIYGMFGFQLASFLEEKLGIAVPWWIPVLVAIALVGVMGVNRIDLSAQVLGILVAVEFIAVIIFDVIAFANPAEGFTAAPIMPSTLFTPGIGAVLAFGIAAFMGFESAAIYSEEAKDPRRTVPRATFTAVVIIGLFYAFSSWALALAIGPDKIASGGISPEEAGPPLFFGFTALHLGTIVVDVLAIFFITSVFAAVVSFHNAVSRYIFSLGREGLFPRRLAATRANGAPWAGSLCQSALAVLVIIGFAIAGADSELGPLYPVVTLFTWLTNAGAMGLVLLMAIVSLAVIGFFRRDPRGAGALSRVIAPALSFAALGTVFALILANFPLLLGQEQADATTILLPALIIGPGVLGVVWGLVLRRRSPALYARIGQGTGAPE